MNQPEPSPIDPTQGQESLGGGRGPGQSMEELFEALESPLLAYAVRLLGEKSLAEDVVQEAFMRLHVHLDSVLEPRRWLFRTVHNLALNHRRQNAKIVPFDPSGEPGERKGADWVDPELLPDQVMVRVEGIQIVRDSLGSMDERSRELLELKFSEGLSYKEISSRTGVSVGHVGYLLHHAVKSIGAKLSKSGVIP